MVYGFNWDIIKTRQSSRRQQQEMTGNEETLDGDNLCLILDGDEETSMDLHLGRDDEDVGDVVVSSSLIQLVTIVRDGCWREKK